MPKESSRSIPGLKESNKIVFTSFSKKNFYMRAYISAFVLENGNTPISPFMNFDYNLSNLVKKDDIRISNNTLLKKSDELWVFGEISDGVLVEIYLAKKKKLPVRYFTPINDGLSFRETTESNVRLEDVSSWMWELVLKNESLERWHPRLRFNKEYPLVYTAYSKKNFYWQVHINKFCLLRKTVPLNPFMLFRYFLGDAVHRDSVYAANQNIIRICDELWTFGEISDGVLKEIKFKKSKKEPVKHFELIKSNPFVFRKIPKELIKFEEPNLEGFRDIL